LCREGAHGRALADYGGAITNTRRRSIRRLCRRANRMVPDKRGAQKQTGRLQMSRPAELCAQMRNKRILAYGQIWTDRTRYPFNSSTHTRRLAQ
jgi:hypothetical protein